LPPQLTFPAIPVTAPDLDAFSGIPSPGRALGPACHGVTFLTFLSFGVCAASHGDLQSWSQDVALVLGLLGLCSPLLTCWKVVALSQKVGRKLTEFPALLPKASLLLTEERSHFH